MPRGRKKKMKIDFNLKPETLRSIFAIVCILFSVLSLISFFASDYSLNAKIQHVLRGTFGVASILIPFLTLSLALLLIDSIKWKIKQPSVLFGMFLVLIASSGLFHLFYSGEKASEAASRGLGGGVFGYKLSSVLVSTISIYGAFIVLLAIFFIAFVMLFNISLDQIVSYLSKVYAGIKEALAPKLTKKAKSSGEVVISTGFDAMAQSEDAFATVDHASNHKKSKPEPSFEIVPTMAEPQNGLAPVMDVSSTSGKHDSGPVIPTLPYADKVWENPPIDLLSDTPPVVIDKNDINDKSKKIKETLKSFDINVEIADIQTGPSVTQYALEAETGTKISKIASLQYDLAMALSSPTGSVRIEAPIPGKSLIGIEVPNNSRALVSFKSLITSEAMRSVKTKLGIVLGKDVGGQTRVYDIGKMPHMLVAGATGSGKSVFLHSLIFSILYRASPQEVNFIMMDPKRTELVHYNDVPHLLSPVITDVDKAPSAFKWAVAEMERRYTLFEQAKVRNIDGYNERSGFQALPYIVIIVDELAEIMIIDPAAVEKSIIRIAQLARATGIHLILAVQRPSTNIITGLIKANIPSRIAFNVASQVDSRVIIDQPGAEKLLGKGDMLFVPPDVQKPVRLQGAYVTDKEIANLVNYLKAQGIKPNYKSEIFEVVDKSNKSIAAGGDDVDPLFDEAAEVVISTGKASASYLQRRFSVGYARAARIIDELEQKGIIGPASGSKPRDILVRRPENVFTEEPEDFTLPEESI